MSKHMRKPARVVVSTLSPEKSASEFALGINTVSPDASESPLVSFGRLRVDSVSPEMSVTPASVDFDGDRFDVSKRDLDVASPLDVPLSLDSLITGHLLSEKELLQTDATTLYAIKKIVLSEVFSDKSILKRLRARIDDALAGS